MKASDCWSAAFEFIARGESNRVLELCEKEPCSASLDCQRFLGWKYYEQDDMEQALGWFSKAAEQGDADALFGIGSVHFAQKDFRIALQYYERAAEHGSSKSYAWIGYIYQLGLGVPKSFEMAIKYYEHSAAHGYILAERALIRLKLQHGNVVQKILVLPRYIYMLIRTGLIAYRDINDKRIQDIPNAFDRKKRGG